MTSALTDYFEALERLKTGVPRVVPQGTRITNDAVSLEAGRGKGTIKKSRPVFADLIKAIEEATVVRQEAAEKYRALWEEALAREASLLVELYEARKIVTKFTGGSVLPIRGGGGGGRE